ncbi:hypothetical protein GCM10010297_68850 [Streptomyces malachitofuscus]|nr:hypothetical protein GCM10010233_65400 [Streptomyces gancidicus]GGX39167.1 hypothetical protein GCM10010297_68850 [Streptomyces malachitofuscus]
MDFPLGGLGNNKFLTILIYYFFYRNISIFIKYRKDININNLSFFFESESFI